MIKSINLVPKKNNTCEGWNNKPCLVMQKICKLKSIFFSIITFKHIQRLHKSAIIPNQEANCHPDTILYKTSLNSFSHSTFMSSKMFQNNPILNESSEINFLIKQIINSCLMLRGFERIKLIFLIYFEWHLY
jgi:hypothetical protein